MHHLDLHRTPGNAKAIEELVGGVRPNPPVSAPLAGAALPARRYTKLANLRAKRLLWTYRTPRRRTKQGETNLCTTALNRPSRNVHTLSSLQQHPAEYKKLGQ